MSTATPTRIEVPILARVEGEGALDLAIEDGHIQELRLRIYEPPRFFEKFVEGYHCDQVIDMVARICGICPVAYQMSAVQAFEELFGVTLDPAVEHLRQVMYCGEWLQSHALHIHLLAAPDFFGHDSVLGLAGEHPEAVRRGLRLQGLGNDLIALCGGRSVHPVGVRVGGFYQLPRPAQVAALLPRLEAALAEARELVAWTAGLPLPDDPQDFVSVALRDADGYAINRGRLVSDRGLDSAVADWERHFREFHVPHSTALHAELDGAPYLVGPLARLNLNRDRLPAEVAASLAATGLPLPSTNMFHSVVARAVEIQLVLHQALALLSDYRPPARPAEPWRPRAGIAYGATEAPRGVLWHRYEVDGAGIVRAARIVPPTSQNQARCEQDLRQSLEACGLDRPTEVLRLRAEQVIRNYDPCISCATHFLRLTVRQAGAAAGAD